MEGILDTVTTLGFAILLYSIIFVILTIPLFIFAYCFYKCTGRNIFRSNSDVEEEKDEDSEDDDEEENEDDEEWKSKSEEEKLLIKNERKRLMKYFRATGMI